MTLCLKPVPDSRGVCARPAKHAGGPHGGCTDLVYSRSYPGYVVRRHGPGSYTGEYTSTGYSFCLLGSYSDRESAIEGLARLKAEGVRA